VLLTFYRRSADRFI